MEKNRTQLPSPVTALEGQNTIPTSPTVATASADGGFPAAWLKRVFGSKVPESERVPVGQKVAYGLGGTTEVMSIWVTNNHFTPILNIGLGMSPALLGWILVIWRLSRGAGNNSQKSAGPSFESSVASPR